MSVCLPLVRRRALAGTSGSAVQSLGGWHSLGERERIGWCPRAGPAVTWAGCARGTQRSATCWVKFNEGLKFCQTEHNRRKVPCTGGGCHVLGCQISLLAVDFGHSLISLVGYKRRISEVVGESVHFNNRVKSGIQNGDSFWLYCCTERDISFLGSKVTITLHYNL